MLYDYAISENDSWSYIQGRNMKDAARKYAAKRGGHVVVNPTKEEKYKKDKHFSGYIFRYTSNSKRIQNKECLIRTAMLHNRIIRHNEAVLADPNSFASRMIRMFEKDEANNG